MQVVKGSYMKYRQTLKRFEGEYQGLFREEIWGKYQKYQIAGPKQEPMEKKISWGGYFCRQKRTGVIPTVTKSHSSFHPPAIGEKLEVLSDILTLPQPPLSSQISS